MPGSNAMEIHESCQVGNEAALSGTFHVTLGSLGVAVCRGILFLLKQRHLHLGRTPGMHVLFSLSGA